MHIAVIGAGMIGAAAARHLASAGLTVTLIGPAEPDDTQTHKGVFASHYDEGRITRSLDPDPFWSRIGGASIARYPEIAQAGGIGFYTPSGCAIAGPSGSGPMDQLAQTATAARVACDRLVGAEIAARFPAFRFPEGTELLHEADGAGHVSPRRLVAAQIAAARAQGARILRAEVTGIDEGATGVTVHHDGGRIQADRALIAAGGFSNTVLGTPLPLQVRARTVMMMELESNEAARLRDLPSLIWFAADGHHPYLLPPERNHWEMPALSSGSTFSTRSPPIFR